jgi:hypothetical protein
LENDLHALNLRDFETLQEYFCKFKTFLSHVKDCGIDKKYEQLIFSILTKLGPEYYVYTYSFHTTRLDMGSTWNMPSLDDFMESLIHEKTNLIQIGALKNSKPHALTTQGSSKKNNIRTRVRRTKRTRRKVNKSPQMRVQVPRHQKEIRRRQSVPIVTGGSILRVLA